MKRTMMGARAQALMPKKAAAFLMRRFGALIACLWLTSLAVPSLSSAQSRPQSEGVLGGLGLGYGSFACSTCGGGREAGGTVYLKLGVAVSESVLLGLEGNLWVNGYWPEERAGVTRSWGIGAAVIQFYPNAESGLFLKGGAGIFTREVGGLGSSTFEDGGGVIVGLGFDARVRSDLFVSPYANYVYAGTHDGNIRMFQIGLGIMWDEW